MSDVNGSIILANVTIKPQATSLKIAKVKLVNFVFKTDLCVVVWSVTLAYLWARKGS